MPRFEHHPHGQFSWVDLNSTDAAAAEAFYTALFGWRAEEVFGGYKRFFQGDAPVAGVAQMRDAQKAGGTPSHWVTYVAVEDAAAIEARAAELGGTVTSPTMDAMGQGRMCFLQDPEGAHLAVWQAGSHPGAGLCNEPVSLAWSELAIRDVDAAKSFYGELFGWTFEDADMGSMVYTMVHNRGRMTGGMIGMTAEWGDMPAHWMVYLAVADLDATTARLQSLGGKVHHGPMEGPPGRWSVVEGPTGEVFTIMQLAGGTGPGPDA